MKYQVEFECNIEKVLRKIPKHDIESIFKTLKELSEDPRPMYYEKLKNRQGYRVRCGKYRVIYKVEDEKLLILVLDIDHRKDIYR